MDRSRIQGCCDSWIIYNLGGAHGFIRANSQEEFDTRLLEKAKYWSGIVIAITNSVQKTEREFLKKIGFTKSNPNSNLISHTISGYKLTSYLNSRKKELEKFSEKSLPPVKPKFINNSSPYIGKVYLADIQRFARAFNYVISTGMNIELLQDAIRGLYGVDIVLYRGEHLQMIRRRVYRAVAEQRLLARNTLVRA